MKPDQLCTYKGIMRPYSQLKSFSDICDAIQDQVSHFRITLGRIILVNDIISVFDHIIKLILVLQHGKITSCDNTVLFTALYQAKSLAFCPPVG